MTIKYSTLLPLFKPRYWLLWVGIGILWCLTRLPYSWQLAVGRKLGRLVYYLARRRRNIAETNLKLCFPELSKSQLQYLLYQQFESLGMGLLEMLDAWWQTDDFFESLWQVEGVEHLHTALTQGNGVILLSAHFHALEMGGRYLIQQTTIHPVYRPHENPVIEFIFRHYREKHAGQAITRDNVKEILQSLKKNKTLWFAMDQNYGHKHSVFVPFFGIPAATNTIISRFAQLGEAVIVPFFTQRLNHNSGGYKMIFYPPLANFPSDDFVQDATRINQLIEKQIRQAPEQYLWVHRRFKDRPAGEERFY